MTKLRVMAVGYSVVEKSTIGNCFVGNNLSANTFKAKYEVVGCTQSGQNQMTACDVPGFPGSMKDVYDIIIKEACKELSVIHFVFKQDKRKESIYEDAKRLFQELKKTKAVKVLIINDTNDYSFRDSPTEAHYQAKSDHIKNETGLEFTNVFHFTADAMLTELKSLKKLFLEARLMLHPQSMASPNLK